MKTTSIILITLFFPLTLASGELINVPSDYPTIQAAIDSAQDYDTVVIAPGTYTGIGNYNVSFRGKSITVRSADPEDYSVVSNTIIDCQGRGRGFLFFMNENKSSKLSGITITNGYSTFGGAIYCYNGSSPTIKNCILKANRAPFGGAIACGNTITQPNISNCIIKENTSIIGGGGLYANAAAPVVKNCIIVLNDSPNGGGLYCHNPCQIEISNCTIADNYASSSAGGSYSHNGCNLTISNSIIWYNDAPFATQIRAGSSGDNANVYLNHCDIQNGDNDVVAISPATVWWDEDSIYSQPNFSTNNSAEYRLAEDSDCINGGDPDYMPEVNETDIDGEPRLQGPQVDIGADEYLLALTASVQVNPPKINLKASNKWLTVFIDLPENFSAEEIETESILLNEQVNPSTTTFEEGSSRLLAKFYLDDVLATIDTEAEQAIITIEGNLIDGQVFNGSDTIELIQDKSKKPKKK